jgi:hypothetical protein
VHISSKKECDNLLLYEKLKLNSRMQLQPYFVLKKYAEVKIRMDIYFLINGLNENTRTPKFYLVVSKIIEKIVYVA